MQHHQFKRLALAGCLAITSFCLEAGTLEVPIEARNNFDPGEQKPKTLTRQETLSFDAQQLALSEGISLPDALKAVRTQEDIGNEIGRLREVNAGQVAGIYVEHVPNYKIIVTMKGNAANKQTLLKTASGNVPVEYRYGAKASTEEMIQAYEKNLDKIKALIPNVQGIGTDEKSGQIALMVFAKKADQAQVMNKKSTLFKLLGHPVKIIITEQAFQDADIRGGSKISSPSSYCTSGFVVKNASNVTGVATAAHCEGINTYYNPNGTSLPLSIVGSSEFKDADQDVEVHTSTGVERPEFYADVTTSARVLTGRRLRSSTAAGNQVCHRGETTGYSCGTVSLTNYKPTYANACGSVACASVWVLVDGDANTACYPGDSGGPVFASQTAFGLLKGTTASGTAKGQCTSFIYMSTDYLPTGWTLLYG